MTENGIKKQDTHLHKGSPAKIELVSIKHISVSYHILLDVSINEKYVCLLMMIGRAKGMVS